MSKYNDLVRVLDALSNEAPAVFKKYHPDSENTPALEQARSKSYIHLFLKAKFGLLTFAEREVFITDGANDGGIDAYYIDKDSKKVFFIQSKFRNSDANFVEKPISYEELLSMDVERVACGETTNAKGVEYNDKIKSFIYALQSIGDLARYSFVVVILANIRKKAEENLHRLVGHYLVEVYNYQRVYSEILLPVITGSFYDPVDLKITLTINRESSGNRIQYYPETEYGECTVNALFVPTIEIAKALYKYKNSILKFNPRSYLELRGGTVNERIAKSITERTTNEFALFNNGITMLSDETEFSDRVGRKNVAEMYLTHPQIINGGQTAYTLCRIYEDCLSNGNFEIFDGKEVLLKVISFGDSDIDANPERQKKKMDLIEAISVATNQQTAVEEADRRANDAVQVELQKLIYDTFGLYYGRKRGEFSDGLNHKYINRNQIIDRDDFLRCRLALENPARARNMGASTLFAKGQFDSLLSSADDYKRYVFNYLVFDRMTRDFLSESGISFYAKYAIVYVANSRYDEDLDIEDYGKVAETVLVDISKKWKEFEQFAMKDSENQSYYFTERDNSEGAMQIDANRQGYYKGRTLLRNLNTFFGIKLNEK